MMSAIHYIIVKFYSHKTKCNESFVLMIENKTKNTMFVGSLCTYILYFDIRGFEIISFWTQFTKKAARIWLFPNNINTDAMIKELTFLETLAMKLFLVSVFWVVTFMHHYVSCDIPNVYEFCSALMSDNRGGHSLSCDRSQCQGIPGKRGPEGRTGPRGLKGSRGEEGTCEDVQEQIRNLKDEVDRRLNLLPKILYCGMGMKSNYIPDSWISASTVYDYRFAASNGRLDNTAPQTRSTFTAATWCSKPNNQNQWIQVDFQHPRFIGGVITQSRPFPDPWVDGAWVKSFRISCGNSTSTMSTLSEGGESKLFRGNTEVNTKVANMFPTPISCRYIRLHPVEWNTHICLRMELIRGECHDLY